MARPDTDMLNIVVRVVEYATDNCLACLQQFMGQIEELANQNEQFINDT